MINEINAGQRYGTAGTVKPANPSSADQSARTSPSDQSTKVDKIELGTRKEAPVTYSKVAKKKLDASDIDALKEQAEAATENLRKLVEELILKQNKNHKAAEEDTSEYLMSKLGLTAEDVEAAREAVSEDGEFGVKAVSDRLVNFAIAVSGGDKSKLSELTAAIDEGFAQAKKTLGGELPDISQKTYDETIRKLNEWAKDDSDS